jgi:hypothetical protein
MAHGLKTGGRRRGSKNKKRGLSDLNEEAVVQSAQSGETPLEYMLRNMRDPTQTAKRRDEMARAAAPYVHARLMAAKMEHQHENEESRHRSPEEIREIKAKIIRRLVEWGLIPPLTEEEKKGFAEDGITLEPMGERLR